MSKVFALLGFAVSNENTPIADGTYLGSVGCDNQSGGYPYVSVGDRHPQLHGSHSGGGESFAEHIFESIKKSELRDNSSGGTYLNYDGDLFSSEFRKQESGKTKDDEHCIGIAVVSYDFTNPLHVSVEVKEHITVKYVLAPNWKTRDRSFFRIFDSHGKLIHESLPKPTTN